MALARSATSRVVELGGSLKYEPIVRTVVRSFARSSFPSTGGHRWKPMGIAMRADAKFGEKPGGLQAPFVFRDATRFVIDDWFIAALLPSLKGIQVSHLTWEMSAEPPTAK